MFTLRMWPPLCSSSFQSFLQAVVMAHINNVVAARKKKVNIKDVFP